jgi:hypothetical protein
MRHADDCDVGDIWVTREHVFSLLRVDIYSSRNDHVGMSVGQV